MTDLIDVYVAGGATRSEDGLMVTLPKGQLKPFDIILRVVPTAVDMQGTDQKERVTFSVLLHDEHVLNGNIMHQIEHEAEITLPVDQIRIAEVPA